MPSIFIWKSEAPNTSKKQIRFYSGSNWALEDYDFSSKSYMFLDQIVIPGFNNSVITYHAKLMSQDWTGSELLEVSLVPYEQIKSDNYGTLERIGNWMRFISKREIDFDEESLKLEINHIEKWMTEKKTPEKIPTEKKYSQKTTQKTILNHQNVQLNFQEFLIKYNMPIQNSINNLSTSTTQIIRTITQDYSNKYNKDNVKHSYNKMKPRVKV
jgi:hypothetical protein